MQQGLFDLSASSLFAGLIFGVLGMWMFSQGKRKLNYTVLMISMALMIYPYFTHGPLQDWGVGVALCALAYFFW
jgi:hypothetical protein